MLSYAALPCQSESKQKNKSVNTMEFCADTKVGNYPSVETRTCLTLDTCIYTYYYSRYFPLLLHHTFYTQENNCWASVFLKTHNCGYIKQKFQNLMQRFESNASKWCTFFFFLFDKADQGSMLQHPLWTRRLGKLDNWLRLLTLIGQKVTNIHVFRVASLADAHTTVVDLK